jgi:hypothetical protein
VFSFSGFLKERSTAYNRSQLVQFVLFVYCICVREKDGTHGDEGDHSNSCVTVRYSNLGRNGGTLQSKEVIWLKSTSIPSRIAKGPLYSNTGVLATVLTALS